jgi:hypothetical protein
MSPSTMPIVNTLVSGSQMTLMAGALISRRSKGLVATASFAVRPVHSLGSEDKDVQVSTALRSQPIYSIAVARVMCVVGRGPVVFPRC